MRNAIAAYAILIPMVLAAALVSGHSYGDVSGSLQASSSLAYLVGGTLTLESGQYQAALNQLEEAVKLDPKSALAYISVACAYQGLNKHKEAIAACDKSLSLAQDANAYATRGFSYGQLGDLRAEMSDYNTAIKLDPSGGAAYAYRARALEKQGNIEAAKRDNEKATSLGYRPSPFDQSQLKQ
jgi:tetratricopeptide (TPR) repeat protein